jgi:hypothetical protein
VPTGRSGCAGATRRARATGSRSRLRAGHTGGRGRERVVAGARPRGAGRRPGSRPGGPWLAGSRRHHPRSDRRRKRRSGGRKRRSGGRRRRRSRHRSGRRWSDGRHRGRRRRLDGGRRHEPRLRRRRWRGDLRRRGGDLSRPSGGRLRRLPGEGLLKLADDRRLYRGGRRTDEFPQFLELGHDDLALDAELLGEFVDPDLGHCSPSGPGRCHGPLTGAGTHRCVLIERSSHPTCFPMGPNWGGS